MATGTEERKGMGDDHNQERRDREAATMGASREGGFGYKVEVEDGDRKRRAWLFRSSTAEDTAELCRW